MRHPSSRGQRRLDSASRRLLDYCNESRAIACRNWVRRLTTAIATSSSRRPVALARSFSNWSASSPEQETWADTISCASGTFEVCSSDPPSSIKRSVPPRDERCDRRCRLNRPGGRRARTSSCSSPPHSVTRRRALRVARRGRRVGLRRLGGRCHGCGRCRCGRRALRIGGRRARVVWRGPGAA